MNPSAEIAVLEGGVDGIAWEKKREAGMPRRLTRITESCDHRVMCPAPLPPPAPHHRATSGTEKNVCDLKN